MATSDVNILVKLTEGKKNPLYFFAATERNMSVAGLQIGLGDFRTGGPVERRSGWGLLSDDVSRAASTYFLGNCHINCSFDG
jgi:hypothetical protein